MVQIVVTGGGTAGHVLPNVALIAALQEKEPKLKITYIGSNKGLEQNLINQSDIKVIYKSIMVGKLRRYFSLQNLIDLFKVPIGIFQAWLIIKSLKPKFVFSKGGYVGLPVVLAAAINKTPIIIHESDASPGLTTRITARFAKEVWCANSLALKALKNSTKAKLSLKPILVRDKIVAGNKNTAAKNLDFDQTKKTVLIMGGSLGAESINRLIDANLGELRKHYNLIHICGKGKKRPTKKGYQTFEYVNEELADFYALADLIIGRSGATSLAEWSVLNKPVILIPLSNAASRGEQLLNAKNYVLSNQGRILLEQELDNINLVDLLKTELAKKTSNSTTITSLNKLKSDYINAFEQYLK